MSDPKLRARAAAALRPVPVVSPGPRSEAREKAEREAKEKEEARFLKKIQRLYIKSLEKALREELP